MNYNKVMLAGNLTRDPEIKELANTTVCNFGLATNRIYTSNGEKQSEVTFVDVEAFGKVADNIAKFFSKGKPIFVEGRLKMDEWQDQQGNKRTKLKVVADTFSFIGGSKDSADGGESRQPQLAPSAVGYDEEAPF